MNQAEFIVANPRADGEQVVDYIERLFVLAGGKYTANGLRKTYYKKQLGERIAPPYSIKTNKKLPSFNWRKVIKVIGTVKEMHRDASYSQNFAKINIDASQPICLVNLCDLHVGAKGTDYDLFQTLTDEIINTPNLYVVLSGDLLETAINLRGVKEIVSQVIEPEMQIEFLASWLDEIKHKVLWATWDNHTVMREEKVTGFSVYKRIIGREKSIIYNNGIGHIDLTVGEQTYRIVSSHKFSGRSFLNPTHSQQRYMRFEGLDREIAMSGDTHKVGYMWYTDGPLERLAINGGTLHIESGYAQRFFSLFTIPKFPCVVLYPDEHLFIPYQSVGAWRKATQSTKEAV